MNFVHCQFMRWVREGTVAELITQQLRDQR